MRRGSAFTPQGREILVLCRISVSAWQRNHCSSTLYLILQAVWYQEMPPSFVPKLTPPPNPFQCGMHGSYSSHFLHLLLDCLGCLRTKAHAPWPNFFFQFTLCSVPQVDSKQSKAWKKNTHLEASVRLLMWQCACTHGTWLDLSYFLELKLAETLQYHAAVHSAYQDPWRLRQLWLTQKKSADQIEQWNLVRSALTQSALLLRFCRILPHAKMTLVDISTQNCPRVFMTNYKQKFK